MNRQNGEKPAYPLSSNLYNGLTKRELFAAMAMQGLANNNYDDCKYLAEDAVRAANALLEELEK